jgi:adenylylsulfate kinase
MSTSGNCHTKCFWFTGLSGAGKTTLAKALQNRLSELNIPSVLLDGDSLRKGLNNNLGFSEIERKENIRRAAEMAKIILESNIYVICAFISPVNKLRQMAKQIIGEKNYLEIFVNTPIETCIERDPKGLYKKALNGEINNFSGIDTPYECPELPDLILNTNDYILEDGIKEIMKLII